MADGWLDRGVDLVRTAASIGAIVSASVVPAFAQVDAPIELAATALGGLEAGSAALLLSGQQGGEISYEVATYQLPWSSPDGKGAPASSELTVLIELPCGQLVDRPEGGSSPSIPRFLEFYVFVIDAENRLAESLQEAVRLPAEVCRNATAEIVFVSSLHVRPDSYSLRVLVRHRRTDRIGLWTSNITVEEDLNEQLMLLRSRPPSTIVRGSQSPILLTKLGPILSDFESAVPSVGPVKRSAESSDRSRLTGVVFGSGAAVEIVLLGERESSDAEQVIATLGPDSILTSPAGLAVRRIELERSEWSSDQHTLALDVGGMMTSSFEVGGQSAARDGPVSTSDPEDLIEPTGRGVVERMSSRYRDALEGLAAGQPEVFGRFAEQQARFVAVASSRDLERLQQALERTLARLGARCATALAPVLQAWTDVYLESHRRKNYPQATIAKAHLAEVASMMPDQTLGAAMMVVIGQYLRQQGSVPSALLTIDQALEFEDRYPPALMFKATLDEHYGQYRESVESLERLLTVRPGAVDAKLRLAINRRRIEEQQGVLSLLEDATLAESWVGAVAVQELAAHHTENGRLDDALAVVDAGVARWPELQRLLLLQASLLDRRGFHRESAEKIVELEQKFHSAGPVSGRLRYSDPPLQWGGEARGHLDTAAHRDLPTLAECLGVDLREVVD